jgi:hypothetical protein
MCGWVVSDRIACRMVYGHANSDGPPDTANSDGPPDTANSDGPPDTANSDGQPGAAADSIGDRKHALANLSSAKLAVQGALIKAKVRILACVY